MPTINRQLSHSISKPSPRGTTSLVFLSAPPLAHLPSTSGSSRIAIQEPQPPTNQCSIRWIEGTARAPLLAPSARLWAPPFPPSSSSLEVPTGAPSTNQLASSTHILEVTAASLLLIPSALPPWTNPATLDLDLAGPTADGDQHHQEKAWQSPRSGETSSVFFIVLAPSISKTGRISVLPRASTTGVIVNRTLASYSAVSSPKAYSILTPRSPHPMAWMPSPRAGAMEPPPSSRSSAPRQASLRRLTSPIPPFVTSTAWIHIPTPRTGPPRVPILGSVLARAKFAACCCHVPSSRRCFQPPLLASVRRIRTPRARALAWASCAKSACPSF